MAQSGKFLNRWSSDVSLSRLYYVVAASSRQQDKLKKPRKAVNRKSLKHRGTENTESAKRRESNLERVDKTSFLHVYSSLLSTIHFLGASPTDLALMLMSRGRDK